MIIICASLLQLLLLPGTSCVGDIFFPGQTSEDSSSVLRQTFQDSPVLQTISPTRGPQVFCYLDKDGWKRKGQGLFTPDKIDTTLCTHINYAWGTVEEGFLLVDNKEESLQYETTVALREKNPNLKILLSIGGFNAGSEPFKVITANASVMNTFVSGASEFLRQYKFDGLEVAWNYPIGAEDRTEFVNLLKKLRRSFEQEATISGEPRLLLTTLVAGPFQWALSGYNVPELSKYVDFINSLMFFFHGEWGPVVGPNAPLYARESAPIREKRLTVDYCAKEWVKQGVPKEKFMIGMAVFGGSFTLVDTNKFEVGSRASGAGRPGKFVGEPGYLAYNEICDFLRVPNTTYVWDEEQQVPYAYRGDQWVGFDDMRSWKVKLDWLKKQGFGGVSVWSIDSDDFRGNCGNGKYPLMNLMKREFNGYKVKLEYRGPLEPTYHINKDREAAALPSVLESISEPKNTSQSCPSDQFHCNNGKCIDLKNRCDGKAHCLDGSDETYSLCKNFLCLRENFRCKYGGCVDAAKRCNRVQDCIDASDEDATLCFNMTSPDGCVAPPTPSGTEYISGFCDLSDTSRSCVSKSGTIMAFGSHLNVRCLPGYSLPPGTRNFVTCSTRGVYTPSTQPSCQRVCPSLVMYPNVEVECRLKEYIRDAGGRSFYRIGIIPCDMPLVEGTTVTFSCPLHFKQEKKILTCLNNGQWDQVPTFECEPLCGIKRDSLPNRIDDGSVVTQEQYPWHAGLYWYEVVNGGFEHIYKCGGSLISQSTVLSAAHCGFIEGRQFPSDQMFVALGKQRYQWDSEDGNQTQRYSVREFLVLPEYTGTDQSFSFDVALIFLAEPVTFDEYVRPVCVNNVPTRFQDDHAIGLLPGWGETERGSSNDLHSAQIPFLPRRKCHALLKKDLNTRILTHDKFCGGYAGQKGPKAAQGDSGGGLVYQDKGLYYVVGVVSTTLLRDNFRIGAYTNVSVHYNWIRSNME